MRLLRRERIIGRGLVREHGGQRKRAKPAAEIAQEIATIAHGRTQFTYTNSFKLNNARHSSLSGDSFRKRFARADSRSVGGRPSASRYARSTRSASVPACFIKRSLMAIAAAFTSGEFRSDNA